MKTKRQTDANTHTHTLSTLSEKKENVIETNEMEKRVPNTMRRKVRKYYFICYKTSKRKKKRQQSDVHIAFAINAARQRKHNLSALRELVPLIHESNGKYIYIYIFYMPNGILFRSIPMLDVVVHTTIRRI